MNLKSTSKLELVVDKNVFYTAAEIDNVPLDVSLTSLQTILKIIRECHTMVVTGEYLSNIFKKLKKAKSKAAMYLASILNRARAIEKKFKYEKPMEVEDVPKDDIDVVGLALTSKDKILVVANIDNHPADEELVTVLRERYKGRIRVLTCKKLLALLAI